MSRPETIPENCQLIFHGFPYSYLASELCRAQVDAVSLSNTVMSSRDTEVIQVTTCPVCAYITRLTEITVIAALK